MVANGRLAGEPRFLALVLTSVLLGCGGAPKQVPAPAAQPVVKAGDAPGWVTRTPRMKGQVCAVGGVDPTFYRQDGRVYAAEAARNELARSVQVHINSIMYDTESTYGGHTTQYIVSEVVTAVSDGVLAGAEILEYWHDDHGSVSRRGMTYALACMGTDRSVADLAQKLQEAFPEAEDQDKVQAVRERARAAFDELEAMETRQAGQR